MNLVLIQLYCSIRLKWIDDRTIHANFRHKYTTELTRTTFITLALRGVMSFNWELTQSTTEQVIDLIYEECGHTPRGVLTFKRSVGDFTNTFAGFRQSDITITLLFTQIESLLDRTLKIKGYLTSKTPDWYSGRLLSPVWSVIRSFGNTGRWRQLPWRFHSWDGAWALEAGTPIHRTPEWATE
jgi:hypothetical protein